MPRAVILTALPVEYSAVCSHLTDLQEETHPQGTIYERGQFTAEGQTWEIGVVEIGAGNSGAALEAERAIAYFSPKIILFVGIAGGIKDVTLGDVVAATKVYGYESGKAEETLRPRPEVRLSAYGLEQRAKAEARKLDWVKRLPLAPSSAPTVYVAPIAAGEKVVASTKSEVFNFLRSHYGDAIAVEMEGLGFLDAARANQQVSALVIRGISDLICNKNEADREGYQEIAARHASAFAFEVLAKSEQPIQERQISKVLSICFGMIAVPLLVFGVRYFGGLEPLELSTFDWFMRNRIISEAPDHRLLVVEITNQDLQIQESDKGSGLALKDQPLIRLLGKLEEYKPKLVGLDVYLDKYRRNSKANSTIEVQAVRRSLHQVNNLIGICKLPTVGEDGEVIEKESELGIAPPDQEDVSRTRIGFSNFADDGVNFDNKVNSNEGGIIRRQLLIVKPPISKRNCAAEESFSFLIARRYLQEKDYQYTRTVSLDSELKFNEIRFPQVSSYTGGYQGILDKDYEILLNYRAVGRNARKVVKTISLNEFLTSSILYREYIKDRIVLIGLSADTENVNDNSLTPYGKLPGVIVHAHMVSQIISAVEDGRPLLWVLPQTAEVVLVFSGSLFGGLWFYLRRSPHRRSWGLNLALLLTVPFLWLIFCLVMISYWALWLPFLPPIFSFFLSVLVMKSKLYMRLLANSQALKV